MTISELYPIIPDWVRDVILGSKPGDGGDRHGRHLPNNMWVNEVEVLGIEVDDSEVAEQLAAAQRQAVIRQIGDRQLSDVLDSERRRNELDGERALIRRQTFERDRGLEIFETEKAGEVRTKELEIAQALNLARLENDTQLKTRRVRGEEAVEDFAAKAALSRKEAAARQETSLTGERNATDEAHRQALAEIEKALREAASIANERELKAIQDGLVEALNGMSNREVLAEIARNLPAADGALGHLLGLGGMAGLLHLLKGTKLEGVIAQLGNGNDARVPAGERSR